MLYIKVENGLPVKISNEYPENWDMSWQSRWDWDTFEKVQVLARYLTAMSGKSYLPVDNGGHVSPRYDLVEAPAVGDEVSYGFNGDFYPDGVIEKVYPNCSRVKTSTGSVYRRRGNTASWMKPGGTWSLVPGHRSEQNPHF